MTASHAWFLGAYLAPSPSNLLLACVVDDKLRICFANAPERCIDFSIQTTRKELLALRWAPDSSRVLLRTKDNIEIVDLEDEDSRIHLSSGSGGLGQYTTAEFIQSDQVLTIWEFGKAKIWNLRRNQTIDIEDVKAPLEARRWAIRRATSNVDAVLAYLTRLNAEDYLIIHFPGHATRLAPIKLTTIDAASLYWSEDGHWLVILDTPRQHQNAHIFTPDGHLYKTLPLNTPTDVTGLGYKSAVWSPDSKALALCSFDDCIDIISGQTLSQKVNIHHSTIIDQHPQTTRVWQEVVSMSHRSYKELAMPVTPPLSRMKQSSEPKELGIAEATFSCDGTYLVSRIETMLSTIWIWDVKSMQPHSVIVQHSNVRRVRWHSKIPQLLLIDCGENIVYVYDTDSPAPPVSLAAPGKGTVSFSLLNDNADSISILAATRDTFSLLAIATKYSEEASRDSHMALRNAVDTEDSIFDILSGKAGRLSDTRRLELEADAQGYTAQLDDTFDGRQEQDPLDDSEIF